MATGEGRPLLLVHELRSSMRAFDAVTSQLRNQPVQVIRYDLPGHGASSLGARAQSLQSSTDILTGICHAAAAENPVLFGEGFGAYLCLHATKQQAIVPHAIVLLNPLFGPPSWGAQLLQQLTSVAVDHLSARTIETLWPTDPGDPLHTRARMTASVRALTEYVALLTTLPPIRLEDIDESIPVHHLPPNRHGASVEWGKDLDAVLQRLGVISPRDP